MSLRIHNSMTREKELFVPATPGQARMYVCGVTPYDLAHVGHARSALVFDVIRRYLTFRGYRVTFVRNFTDVDDKIIARAAEAGESPHELAERYIAAERRDMAGLGLEPPDIEPRATEHIPQMIELIERLLAVGVAYVIEGDVYFEVRRFPGYGRLSRKDLDELRAGARVELDERKRDPLDFALWKASKPGEPVWPSPWGPGRPGWHIECSAMAMRYLGPSFDIHGGGQDLVFPHHENEIAQSEAATGERFAQYWVHNGLVNLGAEKMSKSLGNVLTVEELLKRHEPDAIRMALLGTHYRHPLDFTEARLDESGRALERFRGLLEGIGQGQSPGAGGPSGEPEAAGSGVRAGVNRGPFPPVGDSVHEVTDEAERRFVEAMDDDFNTPQAFAALFDLARALRAIRSEVGPAGVVRGVSTLRRLGRILGLFETGSATPPPDVRREIERLVRLRGEARQRSAWVEADTLRAQLAALGVSIEDTPSGTQWKWRRKPASA